MFISIHIPKTAGTSLGYLFDYGSGRRIMYDYKDDYSNALMDDPVYWRRHKPFIERQFDFIHGHFFYEKYAEVFPDAQYVSCLRHPVDRIISQYNHMLGEKNHNDWMYRAMIENKMDPVDFAQVDTVHNAQALHLRGRAIEDYDFIFISEWLEKSFNAFKVRYHFRRADPYMPGTEANGKIPKMNTRKVGFEITQAMKEKIFTIAREDVDIYRRGSQYCERLIHEILVKA